MIQFEAQWVFILLPLPLLVYWFFPAYGSHMPAVQTPFFDRLVNLNPDRLGDQGLIRVRKYWQTLLVIFMWSCLICAAAKPVWLADVVQIDTPSRDLMVMVDLSGSMDEADFGHMTRLDGAKQVLADFVSRREADRLALVVFGDSPFMLMPFSADRHLFVELLQETRVRMAGAKTMLGDAIGFAYKHFLADSTANKSAPINKQRILILLTDGNDSGSLIPPGEAAQLASKQQIRIYPILLGQAEAVGETAIDETALRDIASITGGVFFRAEDASALEEISRKIDQLEPSERSISYYQPTRALYYWPLLVALLVAQFTHLFIGLGRYWSAIKIGKEVQGDA